MEVKVTVGDYFSAEELRDIVEDEVRACVSGRAELSVPGGDGR